MNRLRVIGWNVQPIVVADDGENLTPLQASQQMIPAAEWEAFKNGGDQVALAGMQEQIDAQAPPELNREHRRANGRAKAKA